MKSINLNKIKNINFREILDGAIAHLKLIATITATISVIGFGLFLYQDFYLTIISAQKIIILENKVSDTVINEMVLNSIGQKHDQKKSIPLRDWSKFNQIFSETASPTGDNKLNDSNNNIEVVDFLQEENIKPVTSF